MEERATSLNPSERAFWFGLGVVLLSMSDAATMAAVGAKPAGADG